MGRGLFEAGVSPRPSKPGSDPFRSSGSDLFRSSRSGAFRADAAATRTAAARSMPNTLRSAASTPATDANARGWRSRAPGADADIAVLDPSKRFTITKEMLHEQDYSPWEGHEVFAWPALTVLRGKAVVEDGRFNADVSDGQYLYRRISDDARCGIAV